MQKKIATPPISGISPWCFFREQGRSVRPILNATGLASIMAATVIKKASLAIIAALDNSKLFIKIISTVFIFALPVDCPRIVTVVRFSIFGQSTVGGVRYLSYVTKVMREMT